MSRLPIVADDLDNWGTILNDYLLQAHKADGTLKDEIITALKISTADIAAIRTKLEIIDEAAVNALIADLSGVTDAATARNNLSVYSQGQVYTQAEVAAVVANYLLLTGGSLSNFLTLHADPTSALHAATKQYVDSLIAPVKQEVFTSTGTFTVPAGVTSVLVSGCAGGGGGGSATGGGNSCGGGGGAGGQRMIDHKVTGLTPGANITVTINKGSAGAGGASGSNNGLAGGNVVFGAYITMSGGAGGTYGGSGSAIGVGGDSNGIGAGTGGDGGIGTGTFQTDGLEGLGSISYNGGVGGTKGATVDGGGGGGGGGYHGAGGDGGNGGNGGAGGAGSNGADLGAGGGAGGGGSSGGVGGNGQFGILIVKW